jgi:serine/threonine-protein kinase RsbW
MTRDLMMQLDAAPGSAAKARRALSELLRGRGIAGERKDFAVLAASELVTNAISHGRDPIELRADVTDNTVHLEVCDCGAPLRDNVNYPQPWSTTGRGLAIVEAVSRKWGVDWHGDAGKTVWAELEAQM